MVSMSVRSGSSCARIWSKYATCSLVPSFTVPESGGNFPSISFISVVLPTPLGPISAIRSPRITRKSRSRTSVRSPKRLLDAGQFRDELAGTLARVERQLRRCPGDRVVRALAPQRFQTAHAAHVARAPRLDALADPRLFLLPERVELPVGDAFGGELVGLARLVRGEVAGIGAQQTAVEFDDPRGHAIEERAVVRDHDRRRLLAHQVLEQRDAVDIEVIGRLVEQQQIRRERQRQRERRALLLATRRRRGRRRFVETEAVQIFDEPRFDAPAFALVGELLVASVRPPRSARLSRSDDAGGSFGSCSTSTTRRPSRRFSSPSSRSRRAAITLSSEDLPVPLRPMRPMRSPSSTAKPARSSSGWRPNASSAPCRLKRDMADVSQAEA